MSNQFPSVRPRRLRQNESLRTIFQETEFRLEDLILPIFVEEGIDDFVPITSMPGVNRIPEKLLAREIERYARAGIKSVMTFGVSHNLDATGSDTWNENGLVARMSRICKDTVPEMVVMSDTCFCEYTSHGHCGVLHDHGVDNDATLANLAGRRSLPPLPVPTSSPPRQQWTARSRPSVARWMVPGSMTPRSWPTPPSSPRRCTARSVKPVAPR